MEATENKKMDFSREIKNEFRAFINGIDVEYRKNLLIAIDKDFCKITGTKNDVDWKTGYLDKHKELLEVMFKKAFEHGCVMELWEVCGTMLHVTFQGLLISELRDSIRGIE